MTAPVPRMAERFSHRAAARHGEVRLPATVAVATAAGVHAALPQDLLFEPRLVTPVIEAALLVALVFVNPARLTRESRVSRVISLVLVAVLIGTNMVSVAYLLRDLTGAHPTSGRELLVAAVQVWITNMIAFALVFWELDRGGAVARLPSSDVPTLGCDFLFPQDDPATARLAMGGDGAWIPTFVDYLYLSITNSVAFSPTDTLPLTSRAKLLMALESLIAMVTSVLVIARAVNIIS